MHLGGGIEVAPARASLDAGAPPHGVDLDPAHARQIDDEATVDDCVSRNVVTTGANGDGKGVVAREPDRTPHVRLPRAAHDQAWASVDHAVEHTSGLVVCVVARAHDRTFNLARETVHLGSVDGRHFAIAVRDLDKSRGASEPTPAIKIAPTTGGQNASATLPVASTSIPADSGPTKASR